MMKSYNSVYLFALTALTQVYEVQAVRNEHWATNIGGIGSPDDKILYQLLTEDSIDNFDGYSLEVQIYYKTREFREIHGNLTLTTKDLPDSSDVQFGFLYTKDQKNGEYDGMHVKTTYIESKLGEEDFQFDFQGYDIWTTSRPDFIDDGMKALQGAVDRKQDFNINPVKCYKKCENGVCKFNAHFWRFFETDDSKDYQFDENDD